MAIKLRFTTGLRYTANACIAHGCVRAEIGPWDLITTRRNGLRLRRNITLTARRELITAIENTNIIFIR